MDDRELIENELLTIKGVCDLYMHGTIESTNADVHNAFKQALNESLDIQNKLYNLMVERGWYQTENISAQEMASSKQKFASN